MPALRFAAEMMVLIYDAQSAACEQMAHGDDPSAILMGFCQLTERAFPGAVVGITILDRARLIFEEAIFPSLDPAYGEALKGIAVIDRPGSCALAVYEGRTVDCDDVREDDRFADIWKALSLAHGMEALISIPAANREALVLGTLVITYDAGQPLAPAQRDLAHLYAGLCGAILAYRQLYQQQQLMVGEFQHRVRNFLSTVGALVYATMRSHPEPTAFRDVFDARLAALAKAHVRAVERKDTELSELLADTLAPYAIDHDIAIDGPPVRLSEPAAMALALAVHELATNAAKYGALSQNGGKLRIEWTVPDSEAKEFRFHWREMDGPPVTAPSHQGFGQRTISKSVSAFDGLAVLHYDPQGLSCSITAPWSERLGRMTH
ncbi:HWE histidine kinase domain-containing protein [Sphingopyxis sp. MWB1]|uniref:HWE histidine kinase domain-containing protein n=1 Tax=Sphingopyxis sp. MWB1 TaxID=1537715 RepID=UPI00068BBFAE|nr:HWE histidine kinase domain-containing protein [Sphingopyxis sp. MWB1]